MLGNSCNGGVEPGLDTNTLLSMIVERLGTEKGASSAEWLARSQLRVMRGIPFSNSCCN